MTARTKYARVDRTVARANGLFRPSQRGSRLGAREITVPMYGGAENGGTTYKFATPYRLGAGDQSVFLAICALAGIVVDKNADQITGGGRVTDPNDEVHRELRPSQGDFNNDDKPIRVTTTHYRLLTEAGFYPRGENTYKNLKESLKRLGFISTSAEYLKGNKLQENNKEHLVTYRISECGEVSVTISPTLARAMISAEGGYARISLVERRQLSGELAKLLHTRLSVHLNPGEDQTYRLDTIIEAFYGDEKGVADSTVRRRRHDVRKALQEIAQVPGWSIQEEPGIKTPYVRVRRPDKGSKHTQTRIPFEGF